MVNLICLSCWTLSFIMFTLSSLQLKFFFFVNKLRMFSCYITTFRNFMFHTLIPFSVSQILFFMDAHTPSIMTSFILLLSSLMYCIVGKFGMYWAFLLWYSFPTFFSSNKYTLKILLTFFFITSDFLTFLFCYIFCWNKTVWVCKSLLVCIGRRLSHTRNWLLIHHYEVRGIPVFHATFTLLPFFS